MNDPLMHYQRLMHENEALAREIVRLREDLARSESHALLYQEEWLKTCEKLVEVCQQRDALGAALVTTEQAARATKKLHLANAYFDQTLAKPLPPKKAN